MRLNIEEECFSRLSRFVDLMGIDAREALGTLAFLWHDSQDELKTEGSFEEIVDWCRITKLTREEQTRWIKTLCRAKFLTETKEGLFSIHGNHNQIDNKLKHLNKSRKGGESTRLKWEQKREGHRPTPGIATAIGKGGPQVGSMQCNAMQSKDNTPQSHPDGCDETADEGKFKPSDLVDLWNETRSPSLPAVIKLTEVRKRVVARALKEYPEAEFWRDVIGIVNRTPFLLGESKASGDRSKAWRCDFDFIVRKDNALKIIEGKYS